MKKFLLIIIILLLSCNRKPTEPVYYYKYDYARFIKRFNPTIPEYKIDMLDIVITYASRRTQITKNTIYAVIAVESNFFQFAISSKNAKGYMQIRPKTFKYLKRKYSISGEEFNMDANIIAGTLYIRELLNRFGNIKDALGFYNAGKHYKKSRDIYFKKFQSMLQLLEEYKVKIAKENS